MLVIVATLGAFAPSVFHDFTGWDDPTTIAANPRLAPPTLPALVWYWTHAEAGLYVPITYSVWLALAAVAGQPAGGLDPAFFHAANVVVHAGSAAVVFLILRRLVRGITPSPWPAVGGALLFALHPVQVEPVAWASGLKDVLSGCLTLAAVLAWLRGTTETAGNAPRLDAAVRALVATGALLVLAMLAKPSAVVGPLLVLVVDVAVRRRPIRSVLPGVLILLALLAPLALVARQVQTTAAVPDVPLPQRPLVAADAISFYTLKLLAPVGLAVDYARQPGKVLGGPSRHLAWIVPALLLAAAGVASGRAPRVAGGILLFLAALLPVLGFTPFMFQVHSTVADHYLYVAMLGPALLGAAIVSRWQTAATYGAAGLVLVTLLVLNVRQQGTWRDSLALFSQAVAVSPGSATARANLGQALGQAGRIEEATAQFEQAVALQPAHHSARRSLAQAYLQQNRFEEAIEQARLAMNHVAPGDTDSFEHLLIGLSLNRLGRFAESVPHLRRVLEAEPGHSLALRELRFAEERAPRGD